jgi:hypothetical protein
LFEKESSSFIYIYIYIYIESLYESLKTFAEENPGQSKHSEKVVLTPGADQMQNTTACIDGLRVTKLYPS